MELCFCADTDRVDRVIRLRCNHTIHASCKQEWARINPTCPICRAEFVEEENDLIKFIPVSQQLYLDITDCEAYPVHEREKINMNCAVTINNTVRIPSENIKNLGDIWVAVRRYFFSKPTVHEIFEKSSDAVYHCDLSEEEIFENACAYHESIPNDFYRCEMTPEQKIRGIDFEKQGDILAVNVKVR